MEQDDVTEAGRELKRAREAGRSKSYFGDGKCGGGDWQEKNCYKVIATLSSCACAAPCHTVLVVHVPAAGPTELTASDAGVAAMPALAIQCDEAFPCSTHPDVSSVKQLLRHAS